ncbi:hypothetical protein, partial [Dictyoglomus sp.]|uniref:hypothetical protein n=1 Tax=Dictyoglomus sp. TaxID=28205 RepID=UPI003D140442
GKDDFSQVIEQISDKEWKLKTKVCAEPKLPYGFKVNGTRFSNIEELLKYLKSSGKDKLTHKDEVVINGTLDEFIDFSQQMVYLGFSPAVYTEEDYKRKIICDRFMEHKKELLKDSQNITQKIYRSVLKKYDHIIKSYRDDLLEKFENIKKSIIKMDNVKISAAVFATK